MTIGIMAAMPDEIAGLIELISTQKQSRVQRMGSRHFHDGVIDGQRCIVVLSGIGKVAAASATTTLIQHFKVDEIVFSGLAGGVGNDARVGDVVIADKLVQHDMDARPLFPQFEIPLTGIAEFASTALQRRRLEAAAKEFFAQGFDQAVPPAVAQQFGLDTPSIHIGMIASGDQFIGSANKVEHLRQILPGIVAVEMEGAAMAQICDEYKLPYSIIRTISDRADATAHHDFGLFLRHVASQYSSGILRNYIRMHAQFPTH